DGHSSAGKAGILVLSQPTSPSDGGSAMPLPDPSAIAADHQFPVVPAVSPAGGDVQRDRPRRIPGPALQTSPHDRLGESADFTRQRQARPVRPVQPPHHPRQGQQPKPPPPPTPPA